MLEENNRLLKELQGQVARVQRHIQWNRVWGLFRLLIILAPIIIGIIYLRPYVQNVFSTYSELLGATGVGGSSTNQSLDPLEQLKW